MYTLLAFIAIFGGVVFIHELGHFLAARSVGVRVDKFYVGFDFFGLGYKVYQGKDTEYGIGLFPFGGYCKIAGMVDESLDPTVTGSADEFNSKNTFQKLWILSAGVIMNFILAIFLFFIIYNFYGQQEQLPIVNKITKNMSINQDDKISEGSTITKINGNDVTYWSDIDKLVNNQYILNEININSDINLTEIINVEYQDSKTNRLNIIELKPETIIIPYYYPFYMQLKKNGAVKYKNDSILFLDIGIEPLPQGYLLPFINEVVEGLPASNSLITSKSLIISMDEQSINSWNDITNFLSIWVDKNIGNVAPDCINIVFKNSKGIQSDCIVPYNGKLGIKPSIDKVKMIPENIIFKKINFLESISMSIMQPFKIIKMQLWGFGELFKGKMSMDNLGGPIKITQAAGEAAKYGLPYFLRFMAIISSILGFMNILPIPGLDGGHGLITIIEGLSSRKIPLKIKMAIQQIAIWLILGLTIFILGNDIRNLF